MPASCSSYARDAVTLMPFAEQNGTHAVDVVVVLVLVLVVDELPTELLVELLGEPPPTELLDVLLVVVVVDEAVSSAPIIESTQSSTAVPIAAWLFLGSRQSFCG